MLVDFLMNLLSGFTGSAITALVAYKLWQMRGRGFDNWRVIIKDDDQVIGQIRVTKNMVRRVFMDSSELAMMLRPIVTSYVQPNWDIMSEEAIQADMLTLDIPNKHWVIDISKNAPRRKKGGKKRDDD